MEREILFRGKDKDGNWVEGDLIHGVGYYKSGKLFILPIKHNLAYVPNCDPLDGVEVIPETVGQFIGKHDSVRIFEGDICTYKDYSHGAVLCFSGKDRQPRRKAVLEISDLIMGINRTYGMVKSEYLLQELEVIGNIHDNPELLNQ